MGIMTKVAAHMGGALGFMKGAMKSGAMGTAMKGGLAGAGGGAVLGGVVGGLSDDGSVLGGAAKGALLGAHVGGAAGYGFARRGAIGAMFKASGGDRGLLGRQMLSMVRTDARVFGRTAAKGYNTFRALGRT